MRSDTIYPESLSQSFIYHISQSFIYHLPQSLFLIFAKVSHSQSLSSISPTDFAKVSHSQSLSWIPPRSSLMADLLRTLQQIDFEKNHVGLLLLKDLS